MFENKTIEKIKLWLLGLTLFIPLFVSDGFFFPFISLKNFIFRFLVLLLALLASYNFFVDGKIGGKKIYIWYAWLIFLGVQILATIFGVNPYHSFWGNYERMDGLLNIIFLTLYFWVLISTLKIRNNWLWFFKVSLLSSWCVMFFMFLHLCGIQGSFFSNASTIGNTAFLGSYLMINFFITAIIYYLDKSKKIHIFCVVTAIALVISILLNASRGSILGLLLGIFVWAIFYSWSQSKKIKYIFFSCIFLTILFSGLVLNQKNSPWVQNTLFLKRLASISRSDFSTNNRLLTWHVTYKAFKDRPILGYGPENIIYGINKYYNPDITEQWFDKAHSFIFDYLGSSGILGLLAYLFIFVAAGFSLRKLKSKDFHLSIIILALIVAYLFSNLFVFDTINTWILIIAVLAFLGVFSHDNEQEYFWYLSKGIKKFGNLFFYISIIGVILVTYNILWLPAKANTMSIDAVRNYVIDPNKVLELYKQSLAYNIYGNSEITSQLTKYSLQTLDNKDFSFQLQKQIFEEAEKSSLEVLKKDPHDVRTRLILAQLYQKYASFNDFYINESIDIINSNITDSPNRLEIYTILAQGYYLKKDLAKSMEYLDKILTISQRRESDYLNAINIALQLKDYTKMNGYIDQFNQHFPMASSESYRLIGKYYFEAGLTDKAEMTLIEKAIPSNPDNPSVYISLASIYESRKEYQKAIDYLNSISLTHPNWEETINGYIKYLEDLKKGVK
jgi:O-antigen ligase/Tfp pilus assembly protein PilF